MVVLLCSTDDAVRKKWTAALGNGYRIESAGSYTQSLQALRALPVDLLLVHRSMVDDAQLRELCGFRPGLKVFVLSDRPDDRDGVVCLRAGCVGYANTYASSPRLRTAVELVLSGLAWVGKSLMQHLLENVALPPAAAERQGAANQAIKDLTPREKEIAQLIAEGLANSGIAARLGISERTVKAHLGAIYSKTGVGNRLALALRVNGGG
ncbi:response regulator transcription factor [Desulfoprunum benzoelyticum]|uniref:DNA-binding NarL/FixJ family response regulator n=1 Tax=Desulfoprunum benzoelyticum TaxID=1506996 RepID=A0A840V2W4_9BACT|nr:response regulator transcription factor [Desulfoprunum benzoelyticum]MBB5348210.1 DNA-binding NarL/FixJ family response regulator [Desulfoprunum benzoelyticum]MBM9529596.1 response regulator transcription factor [Desulfoprunum benzoelyticum]